MIELANKINDLISKSKRNIVFFFDNDRSYYDELNRVRLSDPDIRIIEVDNKYIELKYQLEYERTTQEHIFLYHPFAKPIGKALRHYPLLGLLKANVELSFDPVVEFMTLHGLKEHHMSLVSKYIGELKKVSTQKALASILDNVQFTKDNLVQGLISIALGFNKIESRNNCIAQCFALAVDDVEFSKVLKKLTVSDLHEAFLNWFDQLLGQTSTSEQRELTKDKVVEYANLMKYNVLAMYIEKLSPEDSYAKLKLEKAIDINRIQSFLKDWETHKSLSNKIPTVFSELAYNIDTNKLLDWYGIDQEYGYYTEDLIISSLKELYDKVQFDSNKVNEISLKWIRRESDSLLPENYLHQIQFLFHVSSVYSTLKNYKSFELGQPDDFVREYKEECYKIDLHYRKAMIEYDLVQDQLHELESLATAVYNELNRIYDRYLIDLNREWQRSLKEINFNFKQIKANKQYDFFQENLNNIDYKVAVIVSDALRYELGHELNLEILTDKKSESSIEPYMASVPSVTSLGMSNLLPHKGNMTLTTSNDDLVYSIQEKTTVSTNRETILRSAFPESATIKYPELLTFDLEKGRAFFKTNKLVYIYHDWIDAIGDKKPTEHQTLQATSKALEDIKNLVKKLYNWNVYHVFITSDHGFLYNRNELNEQSREQVPQTKGFSKSHVRYVVAEDFEKKVNDEKKVNGYQMDLRNTTNLDTNLKVVVPGAINRYKIQGNVGVQFVHGGASLQELLVPVIKYSKSNDKKHETVGFKRIDNTKKITTSSIKVILIQDKPVDGTYKSLEIVIGLYSTNDVNRELLSNEVELHLNSSSANPKEWVYEAMLHLTTKGSKSSSGKLLAYKKDDKKRLNPIGMNDLIQISSLMEIDEF